MEDQLGAPSRPRPRVQVNQSWSGAGPTFLADVLGLGRDRANLPPTNTISAY